MGRIELERELHCTLAEAWEAITVPDRRAAWVDGLQSLVATEPGWPAPGATMRWRSMAGGRGEVTERVTASEHRRRLVIEYADQSAIGSDELTVSLAGEGQVQLRRRIAYKPRRMGILGPLTDPFFMRPEMRRAAERELERLARELEDEGDLPVVPAPPGR